MTDQNNFNNNQTTFYNIDIYNDNSTGGDISSIFSTSFQSPLLLNPSHHEITVARARIPLDQIPLSQDNIPFQKWQIEIGVPVVGGGYTYYNSYVPQFGSQLAVANNFLIGYNGYQAKSSSLPLTQPTEPIVLTLADISQPAYVSILPPSQNISNTVFGLSYMAITDGYMTSIYEEPNTNSTLINTIDLRVQLQQPDLIILGITSPSLSNHFYSIGYNPANGGNTFIFDLQNPSVYININIQNQMSLHNISCSTTQLTISFFVDFSNFILNYTLSNTAITYLSTSSSNPVTTSYIDANNNYYLYTRLGQALTYFNSNMISDGSVLKTYSLPYAASLDQFLGLDAWGNLLVSTIMEAPPYTIVAYNLSTTDIMYTIIETLFIARPLAMSPMASGQDNNPEPYPVMTINEYLGQINLAFASIIAQIPQPLSSPLQTPVLVFDSTTSIINIITDKSCLSTLSTACVINFNKLLWSFFKFTSTPAISQNLGTGSRTLTISSISQPQPNSTMYRFSDLTRIIIGTNRMGVKGDNESFNTMLVNIGDFTIDTTNGIPELVIYNPTVLRFYQLYQTTPLLNIDIFVSYANRAGKVFPITISPYNSIGLKLQFRNSNDPNKSYNDS